MRVTESSARYGRVDFTAREKLGHKTLGLGRNVLQWPSLVTKIWRKTSRQAGLGVSRNNSPFVFCSVYPLFLDVFRSSLQVYKWRLCHLEHLETKHFESLKDRLQVLLSNLVRNLKTRS